MFIAVLKVPLGGACDASSSCADDNAVCNSGVCRCMAPHYQKNQACCNYLLIKCITIVAFEMMHLLVPCFI